MCGITVTNGRVHRVFHLRSGVGARIAVPVGQEALHLLLFVGQYIVAEVFLSINEYHNDEV